MARNERGKHRMRSTTNATQLLVGTYFTRLGAFVVPQNGQWNCGVKGDATSIGV